MNSAKVVNSLLTINSGATLSTNNFQLTFGGNYVNNGGSLTAGSSSIVISGTGTQAIAGFTTTGAVYSTKTGGIATLGGNISGSLFTVSGVGGTLNAGSALTHTFSSDVILSAGTFDASGSTINTAGNWTNNGGTFTPSTSTVNFTGNNMAINGSAASQTFNNLSIAKTAGQTLSVGGSTTTLTINGNFTETTGNFTAPATFSVTGNTTLTAGTFTAGTTMNASGNWTNNGATFAGGAGTVILNGATQTISGSTATTFNNLTAGGTGLKTLSTAPTVNGTLSMEGTGTVSAAPTYGSSATLQYNTATARTAGSEWITPFVATGGVVIANTGVITLNSAEIVNAPLTINLGASLNTDGTNNYALTFGGNFTNSGTFTANASNITITGTGTQSIAGFTTTGSFTVDKSAATATLTGNVNAASLTSLTAGGTLNLGTALTHTISGAWTRTNGTVDGGSSTLNIGGSVTNTAGTFTPGTSTVNYTGGAQTLAAVNYNNLTLSGSGTKTLNAGTTTIGGSFVLSGTASATAVVGLTISADLNIGAGTTFAAGTFTHNIAGNFTNSGTFTPGTSTLNLNGTTQSLTGATTFNNLTLAGSGTKTFVNNTTINGNFSIGSGAAANLGTGLSHNSSALYLAGAQQASASWGGTGSGADNINT
ncbi:MAG: hypothetical protein WCQ44_11015, partial [Opitutaceae bacterium]